MDLKTIKSRLSTLQQKKGGGGKNEDRAKNFWRPSVGKATVRIVPSKFDKANPSPKGTTTHPDKANPNVNTGAKIKIIILELFGKTVSFKNNFNPSANGCNNP